MFQTMEFRAVEIARFVLIPSEQGNVSNETF